MQFTVKERLILVNNLPIQGDFITLTLIEALKKKLTFTEEEIEAVELKVLDGGRVTWNPAAVEADIPIGSKTVEVIKTHLKKLEQDAKLTLDMLSLYEKFVGKIVVEDSA